MSRSLLKRKALKHRIAFQGFKSRYIAASYGPDLCIVLRGRTEAYVVNESACVKFEPLVDSVHYLAGQDLDVANLSPGLYLV